MPGFNPFRDRFPYTKLNDINLDWLIKKVRKLSEDVAAFDPERIEEIAQQAAAAEQTAQDALETAEGVSGIASDAETIARAAQTTANNAADSAQAAGTAAAAAQTTADAAGTAAAAAQTTANNAADSAQAAGTAAAAAQTTANNAADALTTYVRPNLLDNWYFVGGGSQAGAGKFPINQRAQTSYSNTNAYTIDRWKLTSGTLTVSSGGIVLNGTIVQTLPASIGRPVVASALLSDGTMITPSYDDSAKTFTLTATGQTIVAVKLEIGDSQTLAHQENGNWMLNEIPDFGQQLQKCKYYFERLSGQYIHIASGFANGATVCYAWGSISPKANTVEWGAMSVNGGVYCWQPGATGSGAPYATAIVDGRCSKNGTFFIGLSGSGFTNGAPVGIQIRDTTTYIDFSCEL